MPFVATPSVPTATNDSEIVGFVLRNSQSQASTAQFTQFQQQFAEGAVRAGATIVAEIAGAEVATQLDVTSRWADGSVKAAVVTLASPRLGGGESLQGMLRLDAPAAAAAIQPGAALAHGYDVVVRMDIAAGGRVTIDAAQALRDALTAGSAEIIRQGPVATEIHVDVPVRGSLHLTLAITTFADGSIATQVQFNNDVAMSASGGEIRFSGVSIIQDGATAFSIGALTQFQYQTWKTTVHSGAAADPTLNVVHDVDYLQRLGVFQNYDLGYAVNTAQIADLARQMNAPSWTEVLGANGLTKYMPQTGGRGDIGPTTAANALWLITQDAVAGDYALGQAAAAGSVPWHFFDAANDTYLSVDDYPRIWIDYRGGPATNTTRLTQMPSGATGWTPDTAHAPDLSYTAYMLTGDQYYLDQLNAHASYVIAVTWPDPRLGGRGIVANEVGEMRSQAWNLRAIDNAAYANPDGSAEKAYFTRISENNWEYLVGKLAGLTSRQGEISGVLPSDYRDAGAIAPWQQDFFASTAAQAALRGNDDAREVLKFQANFLSGRFLSDDLDPHNGYAYNLNVYAGSNYVDTWAEVQQATARAGNAWGPGSTSGGYYAELALMSNAAIISVFSGGEDPTDHAVAANAMRAYGWLLADDDPFLRADVQYQIVPRLRDGTQLSGSEMHVVASTAAGDVYRFNSDNVLIYDAGAGGARLGGSDGADVLIDSSANGNDTLSGGNGDDYLLGGAGRNVIGHGRGNDYAAGGGGADVFMINARAKGHLEIADFAVGRDHLSLRQTTATPDDVIATARADAFGDAVLTIAAGRTVTLVGVQVAELSDAIFV